MSSRQSKLESTPHIVDVCLLSRSVLQLIQTKEGLSEKFSLETVLEVTFLQVSLPHTFNSGTPVHIRLCFPVLPSGNNQRTVSRRLKATFKSLPHGEGEGGNMSPYSHSFFFLPVQRFSVNLSRAHLRKRIFLLLSSLCDTVLSLGNYPS